VKGLNDAHRWPSRPIEPARSGQFEVDDEFVKVNRTEPRICVDRDFGWSKYTGSEGHNICIESRHR